MCQTSKTFNQAVELEKLEDELYGKRPGYTTEITLMEGGYQDGNAYNPSAIEIIVLDHDGDTIAFRYSDDAIDNDWQIGALSDAVNEAFNILVDCERVYAELAMQDDL